MRTSLLYSMVLLCLSIAVSGQQDYELRDSLSADDIQNCKLSFESQSDSSLYFCRLCLSRAEYSGDTFRWALFHQVLGDIYRTRSKYDSAFHHYSRSAEVYQSIDDGWNAANVKSSIARLFALEGLYNRSAEYLGQAIFLVEEDQRYADSIHPYYANLGSIYMNLSEYDRAVRQFNRALNLTRGAGPSMMRVHILFLMAKAEVYQGELRKADSILRAVDAVSLDHSSPYISLAKNSVWAEYYYGNSQFAEAAGAFRKVLGKAEVLGDPDILVHARMGLSKSLMKMGKSDSAIALSELVLSDTTWKVNTFMLSEVYTDAAWVFDQVGDYKRSSSLRSKAITYGDSLQKYQSIMDVHILQLEGLEESNSDLRKQNTRHKADVDYYQDLSRYESWIIALAILMVGLLSYAALRLSKASKVISDRNLRITEQNEELLKLAKRRKELLVILSHDIRSPVWAMRQFLEVLNDPALDESRLPILSRSASYSMAEIESTIQELVEWALDDEFINDLYPSDIDMRSLVDSVFQGLQLIASYKLVDLINEVPESVSFQNDLRIIVLVLRNLIGNSVKFTQSGTVSVLCEQSEEGLALIIKDTGVGMSQDRISALMNLEDVVPELGTTGERGMGVGLKLVMKLLSTVGADIQISSLLGEGTEIRIIGLDMNKSA